MAVRVLRVSKQAYYQKIKRVKKTEMQATIIKGLIEPIRNKMPRYGTEKLHLDLKDKLKQSNIKMGRDRFLKFCRQHHLLVPKTKRFFITLILSTSSENHPTL